MKFEMIDLEKYERKEHFIHYLNKVPCSYSITTNIDITELIPIIKEKEYKLYPV
ncbi:MAG: chloramphenicol acetyltransferase, partial [Eubacterium sp.]|nr:chloramphenicol acetyltransferase [Eubacterium sp.]